MGRPMVDRSGENPLAFLGCDSVLELGTVVSNADTLAALLRKHPEVKRARQMLALTHAAPRDVEALVAELARSVRPGRRFYGDTALAAIAVVLEHSPGQFAENILSSMARVNAAELPMTPRIARIALRIRNTRFAKTTMKSIRVASDYIGPRTRLRSCSLHVGPDLTVVEHRVVA